MGESKSLLQKYYEKHHVVRNRLRRCVLEKERGALFSGWLGQGKRIIDLGGRDGSLSKNYVPGNELIIGDLDEEAMSYAEETYGVGTRVTNLNERLPFDDGEFDAVVMAEVLEHLPYPAITMGEIRRLLKAGGMFIGNVPLAYHLRDRYRVVRGKKLSISRDPTHLQYFTYADVVALLGKYFEVEEVVILQGGVKAKYFPGLFAKNIAFRCRNCK